VKLKEVNNQTHQWKEEKSKSADKEKYIEIYIGYSRQAAHLSRLHFGQKSSA